MLKSGKKGVTVQLNHFRSDPILVVLSESTSMAAEEFRKLVVRLEHSSSPFRKGAAGTFIILSPLEGEGKTLGSVNIALALAEKSARRTLLIDFDLRKPRIEEFLMESGRPGLADALRDQGDVDDLIQYCPREQLHVLTAGTSPEKSVHLLSTGRISTLLTQLKERFDCVVGDCPPLLPFSEGRVLASVADTVMLIARAERTPRSALIEAVSLIEPERLFGVILNAVPSMRWRKYGYGYYSRRGQDSRASK